MAAGWMPVGIGWLAIGLATTVPSGCGRPYDAVREPVVMRRCHDRASAEILADWNGGLELQRAALQGDLDVLEREPRRLEFATRRLDEVEQEGQTLLDAIYGKQLELVAIDDRLASGPTEGERATMQAVADALASVCAAQARDDTTSDGK